MNDENKKITRSWVGIKRRRRTEVLKSQYMIVTIMILADDQLDE